MCVLGAIGILFCIYLGVAMLLLLDFKLRPHVYAKRFEEDIQLDELDENKFKKQMVEMILCWPLKLESLCGQ